MRKDEKIMQKRAISWIWVIMIGLSAIPVMLTACSRPESGKDEKEPALAEKKEGPGVVVLSEEKQKASGIEVQKVSLDSVSIPLSTSAVIEQNADKVSRVSTRVTGRIIKVMASQGDRVKAGQLLAYLDSVELDQSWAEYIKAKARLELAQKNLKREETLFEKKVSPEKDVLKARQEVTETEADLNLSRERFRLLGIDVSQVEQQKNNKGNEHHPYPLIPIASAITGVVLEKAVSQGEVVGPEKALFTVADLSTLWVILDIYEKDIHRLHVGTPAKISVTAFPDKEFRGTISLISDVLDEKTRTAKARVTVDNSSGLLKLGMFAKASMDSGKDSSAQKVIAVPEEAVFLDGPERYVFIQEGDERFVARRVSVGPASGLRIEIKEGLKVGDVVVTRGVFTLKSELKKETLQAE